MAEKAVKVFISYSWDSNEHKEKVLALSENLRKYGVDCQIDRYHQSPPEGWHRWMMERIEESDFVLVVCTEKYNLRYQNKEERGQGRGVTWEGGLIIAKLYDGQGINDKFIPILLSPEGEDYIPQSLRAYTIYRPWNNDNWDINKQGDYQNLYRHLTQQPAYVPALLGEPQILLPISGAPSIVGDHGEIIQAEASIEEENVCLEDLLKAKKWKEADEQTKRIILTNNQNNPLTAPDIRQLSFDLLVGIDRLWMRYSDEKFGLRVQQQLWQKIREPEKKPRFNPFAKKVEPLTDSQAWNRFGCLVGWRSNDEKILPDAKLDFSTKASPGFLPRTRLWLNGGHGNTVKQFVALMEQVAQLE